MKRFLLALLCALTAFGALAADKHTTDDMIYDQVKRKLANDQIVKGGSLDIDSSFHHHCP